MRHATLAIVCLLAGIVSPARAQINALGVMGDSLSDEYFEETYGVYATNWVQQLVLFRGINVGPTGAWGSPRRTGYAYNWALAGDDSGDLLAHGQHIGLASQVTSNGVTHAVLAIGANDFHPTGTAYIYIYNGWWSTSQINTCVAGVLTNIETALVTVKTTDVRIVVLNLLDYGKTPAVYGSAFYSNGTNRERVAAAIEKVNGGLLFLAQKYQVPLVDAFRFQKTLFGSNTNLHQYASIGNVTINLQQGGSDPTLAFVEDNAHPHTTIQGLFANAVLTAFRLGHNVNIAPFTEAQILAHAGLSYGGADTLAAQVGDYRDYIVLPIRPQVTSLIVTGGLAQLRFSTVSNQFYRVERTDSLTPPSWTPLTNNVPGTGAGVLVTDPGAAAQPQRFYRVRQLP
jgi:hypothetical protein